MSTVLPAWFPLLQHALHANPQPSARYLQLASLDDSGAVTCRTLVCRALLDATASLVMTTDLRSTKVKGLKHHRQAEACWYLPARQQQFRLRGEVTLKGPGRSASLRDELWERLSEASRQTFTRPAPGHSLGQASAFTHPAPTAPPDCFGLLVLQPFRVDYLDLAASPHERQLYEYRAGEWHQRPLNP
ncbi:pyridoxamine 5'-phosphate oxidase family protein [Isoalcanivorax indicus]|uniref:pyridoxamine 5'-phosphate oxidase family protein n=1 Tax=Isoalcanivorax indicus TaxID=2202653 RepID=UPI000DB941E0|nr:pyridoxamine 5'-phosphate oxidase family protein [Isoalcanivorax indicus]